MHAHVCWLNVTQTDLIVVFVFVVVIVVVVIDALQSFGPKMKFAVMRRYLVAEMVEHDRVETHDEAEGEEVAEEEEPTLHDTK